MPAPQRRPAAGVIDQLLQQPYRFEFFQAVRLLESWLRQNGAEPGLAQQSSDYLRFRNRLALSFPPGQLDSVEAQADQTIANAAQLLAALRERRLTHIDLTPAFMGFLGANGALPLHYTQRIAAHESRTRDDGPRAFLDLFSQRAVALFYQAWKRHRPEIMHDDDGGDKLLPILHALAGLHGGVANRAFDITDDMLGFYAAQWRSRAVPAAVIAGVLAEYFGVPIKLEQLVGAWRHVQPRHQAQLGRAHVALGCGVLLGARVYGYDSHVRVRIGPLPREMFERFLPGAPWSLALRHLLGRFCGAGMTFQVHLVLRKSDVHGASLGGGARIGTDAFLRSTPETGDRDDLRYLLQP